MYIEELNFILATGALLMQLAATALLLVYFFAREEVLAAWMTRFGMWIAFVLVLGSVAMTLLYSEVFGYAPCGLCWLQRVFLYPQAILLGLALWRRHTQIADYIIGLSAAGALVALYQHYLQMGGTALVSCPVVSTGTDCAERFLFEFGYITFPLMSFTIFVLLIILMLFVRSTKVSSVT